MPFPLGNIRKSPHPHTTHVLRNVVRVDGRRRAFWWWGVMALFFIRFSAADLYPAVEEKRIQSCLLQYTHTTGSRVDWREDRIHD